MAGGGGGVDARGAGDLRRAGARRGRAPQPARVADVQGVARAEASAPRRCVIESFRSSRRRTGTSVPTMNATTITELTRENGWAPLREHLGARAFGINAYTKNADERIVGEHTEEGSGHEELYLVVAGRARFTVEGEERDAPVGTVVLVESGTKRSADALEDGTTIVVVGGRP